MHGSTRSPVDVGKWQQGPPQTSPLATSISQGRLRHFWMLTKHYSVFWPTSQLAGQCKAGKQLGGGGDETAENVALVAEGAAETWSASPPVAAPPSLASLQTAGRPRRRSTGTADGRSMDSVSQSGCGEGGGTAGSQEVSVPPHTCGIAAQHLVAGKRQAALVAVGHGVTASSTSHCRPRLAHSLSGMTPLPPMPQRMVHRSPCTLPDPPSFTQTRCHGGVSTYRIPVC